MTDGLMAVVVCGGESLRMGSDKGLLLKDGKPWARWMADKLAAWPDLPVVFSLRAEQLSEYRQQLGEEKFVTDDQGLFAIGGPLKGLLSVHRAYPQKDILLLGCDMLDMDTATIGRLLSAYEEQKDWDAYAFAGGGFFQPLCTIYRRDMIVQSRSLQQLLRDGRTMSLEIPDKRVFANYNTSK